MQIHGKELLFSATDLVHHLECHHLTGLERERAHDRMSRPAFRDEAAELTAHHGELHERRYLAAISDGRTVTTVEGDNVETRASNTERAMRSGVDVIYQATFIDGVWTGRADFLIRVKRPSALGDYSYEVYDTKVARTAKATALVQLAEYSVHVTRIQRVEPQQVHLVLGDDSIQSFPLAEIAPYHWSVRSGFLEDQGSDLMGVYPEPVEHCARCPWRSACRQRRIDDDHLTLVADLGRTQAAPLVEAGITTLTALAEFPIGASAPGVRTPTLERLRHQAMLQLALRATGQNVFELLEPDAPRSGLEALPEPSSGDVFFDIEGDPFLGAYGLEYLFGCVDSDGVYSSRWATNVSEEKEQLEMFVDDVGERLAADEAMHVYHFGHYEPTTLKRLAAHHGTREHELDVLLRRETFVDLHRITRQALRASVDSYSIKRLEIFYREPRHTEVSSGIQAAVAFEAWLGSDDGSDRALLERIEEYNGDDCQSARLLRDWLEERRPELEAQLGRALERPAEPVVGRSEVALQIDAEVVDLQQRLLGGVPEDPKDRDSRQDARAALSHLLSWHRRELRSEWWAYFDRRDLDDTERFDHNECIAQLEYLHSEDRPSGLVWHTYSFDPNQELKLRSDAKLIDPATESSVTVKSFDLEAGELVVSRRATNRAPHPRSLMVGKPPSPQEQEAALRRVAVHLLEFGPDAAGVGYRLLCREPPKPLRLSADAEADVVIEACERATALAGDFLAIQGPPGSGKTYTGARIIRSLIASGRTVAICANSHAVINNLLRAVVDGHPTIRVIKKGPEVAGLTTVDFTDDYGRIEAALDVGEVDIFAGTTFALSRPQFADRIDTLVIDEAGQMSLANSIAASQVARNLVLLGDPQQLSQPTKAAHPPGTDSSALAHLLGQHDTMPAELGMFLPETRRMHPSVCAYISDRFYDGRLTSFETCAVQSLGQPAVGIHLELVGHTHRSSSSPEEAIAVAALVDRSLGAEWTDQAGTTRRLVLDDILVVTPYNAQVRTLQRALGAEANVGTVDLFQGQEAPLVIYSMTSSSADLAPRGMDFLYDLHRLNVAISRAQAAAIVVCNPALLRPACKTPHQVRLASALCHLAEFSTSTIETTLETKYNSD